MLPHGELSTVAIDAKGVTMDLRFGIHLLLSSAMAVFVVLASGNDSLAIWFSVLALACIWFPDAMGSYMGSAVQLGNTRITRRSPPFLVRAFGYLLLVLPYFWKLVSEQPV